MSFGRGDGCDRPRLSRGPADPRRGSAGSFPRLPLHAHPPAAGRRLVLLVLHSDILHVRHSHGPHRYHCHCPPREEARLRDQEEKAEFEDRLRARDEAKTKKVADKEPKLTREEARREEMKRRWSGVSVRGF